MVLVLMLILSWSSRADAFVLLSGPTEARLAATREQPKVTFLLHPTPPAIAGKEDFAGGIYQGLSDQEFWLVLVQEAMAKWNAVSGSFIELEVELSAEAQLDSEDRQHAIVVTETNLSAAAYAAPQVEDLWIVDCDIGVSGRRARAEDLAYTLLHELGHCLGLGHNHSDFQAVMGYSRTDRSLRLGLDDEAGLIYLYPDATVGDPRERISCGLINPRVSQRHGWQALLLIPIVLVLSRIALTHLSARMGRGISRNFQK